MLQRAQYLLSILITSLAISACGGGGGGGGDQPPAPASEASQPDTTPDSFSFSEITNVSREKEIVSAAITVTGINAAAPISVSGGYYSIDNQDFVSTASEVNNGAQVRLLLTSSNQPNTKTSVTLTIGAVSGTFSVTTSSDISPPQISVVFPPENGMHSHGGTIIRGTSSSSDIVSLSINGEAVQTADDFNNWKNYVNLEPGENIFTVIAEDTAGNSTSTQIVVNGLQYKAYGIHSETVGYSPDAQVLYVRDFNNRPGILTVDINTGTIASLDSSSGDANLVVFDHKLNRLIGIGADGIYQIDTNSGDSALLFNDSGLSLQAAGAADIALDSESQTLYVFHTNDYRIISIDLNSGERKLITSNSTIFGNELAGHVDMDFGGGRLVATSGDGIHKLLNINLATGQRELISDSLLVAPNTYNNLRGLVVEGDYAYVADVHGYLLRVDARDGSFSVVSDVTEEKQEHLLINYEPALELDSASGKIFVLGNVVFSIDLVTGQRSRIDKPLVGAGPAFGVSYGLDAPISGDHVYALTGLTDEAALIRVDRASGDRTLVSNSMMGSGDSLTSVVDLALDQANGLAYVAESTQITRVDLATGERTVASGNSMGSGDVFSGITALEYDPFGSLLFVNSAQNDKVFSVNPVTGDRSVIYGPSTGSGPFLAGVIDIDINPTDNTKLYLVDNSEVALIALDLTDNSREIISSSTKGDGPLLDYFNSDLEVTDDGKFAVVSGYYDAAAGDINIYIDLASGDRFFAENSLSTVPVTDAALVGKEYKYTTTYGMLNLNDMRTGANLVVSK